MIINLRSPQSFSFQWSGNWSPVRLVTMTHPKWPSQGQKESITKGVTLSLELGSLPPLLSPHTHFLVTFAKQEAKSQPWFWEVSFQGRQVLSLLNRMVNHSGWKVTLSSFSCGQLHGAWPLSTAVGKPEQSCLKIKPLLWVLTVLTYLWGSLHAAAMTTPWAGAGDAEALYQDHLTPSLGKMDLLEKINLQERGHF